MKTLNTCHGALSLKPEEVVITQDFSENFEQLYDISECECSLKELPINKEFVKPQGPYRSKIVIVGQNPSTSRKGNVIFGKDDSNNHHIVGYMLEALGLSFDDVYITNAVKCSTPSNDAFSIETEYCATCVKTKLSREIELVDPELVICLGKNVYEIFKNSTDYDIQYVQHPSYIARHAENEQKRMAFAAVEHLKKAVDAIKQRTFINFHVHNEFSIRDGIGTAEEHAVWALKHHQPCSVITNHGNVNVFFKQYTVCKRNRLKPVFGAELYVIADREKLMPWIGSDEEGATEKRKEYGSKRYHLLLLAKNYTGLKNLFKITSLAFMHSFYKFPLIDFKLLAENKEGLIVSTACSGGELAQLIAAEEVVEANAFIEKYKKEFGDDFYIELMSIAYEHQWKINKDLVRLAAKHNVETILTTDAHYLYPEDQKVHEAILLLQSKKTFEDTKKQKEAESSDDDVALDNEEVEEKLWEFTVKDLYLKSYKDIDGEKYSKVFGKVEDEQTKKQIDEIVSKCVDNGYRLFRKIDDIQLDTDIKIPQLHSDGAGALKEKIDEGLKTRRIIESRRQEYIDRAKMEFEVVTKLGFEAYFLILEDLIAWTRKTFGKESVGAGRGSASGSLINYLLKITDVDPIRHDLLFERFLDEGRKDLPDVDIDFEPRIRDSVKQYLVDKYGSERVATIGNYQLSKVKAAIKDAARIHNIDFAEVNAVTGPMPFNMYNKDGEKESLDNMSYETLRENFEGLNEFLDKYPDVDKLFRRLRNSIKSIGRHAAGVVVSSVKLHEWIPLIRSKEHIVTANTEGGDYHELTGQGFVKFDILGLNNLQVVNDTVALVAQRTGRTIEWDDIDLESPEAYRLAAKGDTFGVFQFESNLATKTCIDVAPTCFNDLSAINAIIRPGPLDMGMHKEFAKRKRTGEWKSEVHPSYEHIVSSTYGVLAYQEQCMKCFSELGEFTAIEVNKARKDLVKYERTKRYEDARLKRVDSWKDKFVTNASKRMPQELAESLWERIRAFNRYAFNRSHCDAYTYTSFREFWLKAHYGIEFYTALLNNTDRSKEDKYGASQIAKYISHVTSNPVYYYDEELKKFKKHEKVRVLPIDINTSQLDFSIENTSDIRFGLTFVKGITPNCANAIIAGRPWTSIDQLIESPIKEIKNKRTIMALILSGALDSISSGQTRSDLYNYFIKKRKYKEEPITLTMQELIDWENELTNVSFTEVSYFLKLKAAVAERVSGLNLVALEELSDLQEEQSAYSVFRVTEFEQKTTKKKKKYHVASISDGITKLGRIYCWGPKGKDDDLSKHIDFSAVKTTDIFVGKIGKSGPYLHLREAKLIKRL